MWKIKSPLLLLVLVTLCGVASAETNFVPPEHIDLTKILAPAPARGSEREKRDLAEILATQKSRTTRQTERALADATAGIFGFADVLGQKDVVLDPSRVAAQVVSGIGFLGAGSILLRGEVVRGA